MTSFKSGCGFALIEALVSAAILSTVLAFAVGAYLVSTKTAGANGANVEATFLADEGIDAVRVIRDKGWSVNITPLTVNSTYYLTWSGSTWVATTTNTYVDNTFERKFVLSAVYRDANSDIAASGNLDPNTKKVTVSVSYLKGSATTTKTLVVYITNILNN